MKKKDIEDEIANPHKYFTKSKEMKEYISGLVRAYDLQIIKSLGLELSERGELPEARSIFTNIEHSCQRFAL